MLIGAIAGLLLPPSLHIHHGALRYGSLSTPRLAPVRLALDDDAPKDDDAPTDDTSADASSDALYAALRSRQKTLEADSAEIDRRWRKADCTSKVRAALDGWIRRLACEKFVQRHPRTFPRTRHPCVAPHFFDPSQRPVRQDRIWVRQDKYGLSAFAASTHTYENNNG